MHEKYLRTLLKFQPKMRVKLEQAQKQLTKQKLKTKLRLKQLLPTVPLIKTTITEIGKEILVPPVIFLKAKPRKKKKKKRAERRRDQLIFTPGFTARALGIAQELSPKQLRRLAREPIGIRPIPIFK